VNYEVYTYVQQALWTALCFVYTEHSIYHEHGFSCWYGIQLVLAGCSIWKSGTYSTFQAYYLIYFGNHVQSPKTCR